MIIFPAIDIMDGKPVRLLRGDFDTAEQVAEDVLTTACLLYTSYEYEAQGLPPVSYYFFEPHPGRAQGTV